MKKFLSILLFTLFACSKSQNPMPTPQTPILSIEAQARALQQEIETGKLLEIARKTDRAISAIVSFSAFKLRQKGLHADADALQIEYAEQFDGFLTKSTTSGLPGDIGDHKPLIEWLTQVTAMLYAKLGFDVCKALHITDLDVINYGIPVVFHPCTFPMDALTDSRQIEYGYHFAHSPKYGPAFLPVVAYWSAEIGCSAASWGTGAFFICAPIAMGVEILVDRTIAPGLSNRIFTHYCGK